MDDPLLFGPIPLVDGVAGVTLNGHAVTLADALAHNVETCRRLADLYRTRGAAALETAAFYDRAGAAAAAQLAAIEAGGGRAA